MKKLFIAIAILFAAYASAQTKVGQSAPNIQLSTLLNARNDACNLRDLKGKVIWLELWATWCPPCVAALQHLQLLQRQFAGQLQIITISTESEKRIAQFIKNKQSNLWFAVDTANTLRQFFPYHTIPHAILIDKRGKVVAITEPGNITNKIINDVINDRPIDLPLKQDNMDAHPIETYFHAVDTVKSRLLIQPEIKGISSMSKIYSNDNVFKNRRITMINLPLETMYRIAYGDLSSYRTINLSPKEDMKQNQVNYCIDLIVPKGEESALMQLLIKELKTRFDVKVELEKRTKEVCILEIVDPGKIKQLKVSADTSANLSARHDLFNGTGVKLGQIANYLEGFGIVKMPVVDDTGLNTRYDISFEYQPEKDGSLTEALSKLGLKLEKGERDIDMLVFR